MKQTYTPADAVYVIKSDPVERVGTWMGGSPLQVKYSFKPPGGIDKAFRTAQILATKALLARIESITNLQFVLVDDAASNPMRLRFVNSPLEGKFGSRTLGPDQYGNLVHNVALDTSYDPSAIAPGSQQYWKLLHETLHALAFKDADPWAVASEYDASVVPPLALHFRSRP